MIAALPTLSRRGPRGACISISENTYLDLRKLFSLSPLRRNKLNRLEKLAENKAKHVEKCFGTNVAIYQVKVFISFSICA
jgi:hypothetical protein